jgi:hypothetical protein
MWVIQIFFLAIYGTFETYVTKLRGTFIENVKKSQKSTHPSIIYTVQYLPHCNFVDLISAKFGRNLMLTLNLASVESKKN